MSDSHFHSSVRRLRTISLAVGVIGALACIGLAVVWPDTFFKGYLIGFMLWFTFSLGALGWTMIHHLTGGDWGRVLRGPFEAAMSALPLLALLFLPIVIPMLMGKALIYPWSSHEFVAAHPHVQMKTLYLNPVGFTIRAAIYFAYWIALSWVLLRMAPRQDEPGVGARLRGISGPGMLFMTIILTFASVDWMMSLEPEWYSTIYGMHALVLCGLAAMSLSVLVVGWSLGRGALGGSIEKSVLHDLGKWLFMIITFYMYLAFSQFLITWSGNLPEETIWYAHRGYPVTMAGMTTPGGLPAAWALWRPIPPLLVLGHFVLPFVILISRHRKRKLGIVMGVAVLILVMHVIDLIWLIVPAFETGVGPIIVSALVSAVGVGGLWLWVYGGSLLKRPWPAPPAVHHGHHAAHAAQGAHP